MLRLSLLWVGKTKEAWLQAGIDGYLRRLEHYLPVEVHTIKDAGLSGTVSPEEIMRREAAAILKKVPKGAFTVALAPAGRALDSPGLANFLTDLEERAVRDLCLVIGGPFGLAPSVFEAAQSALSLSRLTFTHEMARLILVEQLYRAWTIKSGEPYHN